MVCMTLLQGIVGDVKGYTMSFHPFMCMQTYFQLSTQPVKTHTQKTLPPPHPRRCSHTGKVQSQRNGDTHTHTDIHLMLSLITLSRPS